VERGSRVDVVFSCINALAQDVAKLPYNVRQDTEKGKKIIKNQVYKLINSRPNQYTSSFNFWYYIITKMLATGNGYAFIKRGASYKPEQLIQLDPDEVTPVVIEGQVFYQYRGVYLADYDVLHYKLYSFDGILGVSPIVWCSNTFGIRLKQEKYSAKVLGTRPPGVLSFGQTLNAEQSKQNQEAWEKATTGDNTGKTPVLSGDAKYTPFMIPPSEGQMIEASELNDQRLMGIYRVPPTIIQNYKRATFSNAEQQNIIYLMYALTPIMKVIEQETDYKLFSEKEKDSANPLYTAFNYKAMLQGDTKTQAEWYKMLRTYGLATANEIRELEDWSPLEGEAGDMVVIQGAMIPIDILKDFYSQKSADNNANTSARNRQIGFDLQNLKEALERIETMNQK
jgi:HK97 family phage portal protein